MELTKEFRERFVKRLQGRDFILYGGLLELARQKGIKRLEVEIIQVPSEENGNYAVCTAVLEGENGEVYREVGDASPENVNKNIAPHLLRMAATRAKARALRDFTGVDMVALEELVEVEAEDNVAQEVEQEVKEPEKPAEDDAEEKTMACSECGAEISEKVKGYSEERFGRALCMKCQNELRKAQRKLKAA